MLDCRTSAKRQTALIKPELCINGRPILSCFGTEMGQVQYNTSTSRPTSTSSLLVMVHQVQVQVRILNLKNSEFWNDYLKNKMLNCAIKCIKTCAYGRIFYQLVNSVRCHIKHTSHCQCRELHNNILSFIAISHWRCTSSSSRLSHAHTVVWDVKRA